MRQLVGCATCGVTRELTPVFEEGKEAEYFGEENELLEKVRFYTTHDDARARIAAAGRQRCIAGRYAYVHRMAEVLDIVGRAEI